MKNYVPAIAYWLHRVRAAPCLPNGGMFAQTTLAYPAIIVVPRNLPGLVYAVPLRSTAPQTVFDESKATWHLAFTGPLLVLVIIRDQCRRPDHRTGV